MKKILIIFTAILSQSVALADQPKKWQMGFQEPASQSMRDIILMTSLIEELNEVLKVQGQALVVRCKVFEDNNGALELANAPK